MPALGWADRYHADTAGQCTGKNGELMPAETTPEEGPHVYSEPTVRPLREHELSAADRVVRLAFGTMLGLPDPTSFLGDADLVGTRFAGDASVALAAVAGSDVVGYNCVSRWGSVGFFGPLAVHPEWWNRGVAQKLIGATLELFAASGTSHLGLFTAPESIKHLHLYQKFDFWPRFLTPIMQKVGSAPGAEDTWSRFSRIAKEERTGCLRACRAVTDAVLDGLDVTAEIQSVEAQCLGDTVLLWDGSRLAGFAVCHCGADSEAGSGTCYVKFGVVLPGPRAAEYFARLLNACEALATAEQAGTIVAGVNMARHDAYRRMLAAGYRTQSEGIALHRQNDPGYNRPDVFLIDDWR